MCEPALRGLVLHSLDYLTVQVGVLYSSETLVTGNYLPVDMMYYPSRLESWPTPLSANCENLKLCSSCYSFFREHFILLVSTTKNQPDDGTTHRYGHFLGVVSVCVVLCVGLSFSFIVEVKFLAYTVKPVLNGISRDQNIFPLKPGFRLIKVHYIQYKKLNQDMHVFETK